MLILFYVAAVLGLLLVAVFETVVVFPETRVTDITQFEFLMTLFVELGTVAVIPVSLRMFKFRRVADDLHTRHEKALLKWGLLRLQMLFCALFINIILYYAFMNTSFGYLAIIVALCLPFVYPSIQRCTVEACIED